MSLEKILLYTERIATTGILLFTYGLPQIVYAEEAIKPENQPVATTEEKTKQEADQIARLACVLYKKGKFEEAKKTYERALELNKYDSEAAGGLANTYEALKDYTKAEEFHKQALKLNPSNLICNINYGVFLCDIKKDFLSAIPYLEKALSLNPDDKVANSWRVYVRKKTGK